MSITQQLKNLYMTSHGFPLGIKSLHLLLTDILTVAQVAVSHIKPFHSTGAGVTRMQPAKVVIASVLSSLQHVLKGCLKVNVA